MQYTTNPIPFSLIGQSHKSGILMWGSTTATATLYVDAWGEVATGDSGCTLSLLGYELASTYAFDLAVDEGEVEGSAALDLVLWESNFDAVGTVQDGELLAEWESSLLGYIDFAGELDLVRISRETEADG